MKRFNLLLISVFLLSLALPVVAFSATLCVNPGGTGNCYGTIQAAVNAAAPFDVIQVYEGVYYENVYIPAGTHSIIIGGVKVTTSRVKGVGTTIVPADPKKVIVDAFPLGGGPSGPAFWLDGAGNVTIRNLKVRNAWPGGGSGQGANIFSDGAFTMIDNVHSVSSRNQGIYIRDDDATVRNSNISGSDWRAIDIDGDRATVQYNTIWNNDSRGVIIHNNNDATITGNDIRQVDGAGGDDCVQILGGDNHVITDNFIAGCADDGIETNNGNNALISMNTILSVGDNAINPFNMTNSTVSMNHIEGSGYRGIHSDTNNGSTNNTFSNNTVENAQNNCFFIREDNPTIIGNTGRHCKRSDVLRVDCFSTCTGGTISDNHASYATDNSVGLNLNVDNITISGNTAEHNSNEGFNIDGDNNTISGNTARYNGTLQGLADEGIDVDGDGNNITNNISEYNSGRGFNNRGNNTLTGNTSSNNDRTGIFIESTNGGTCTVDSNTVTDNNGEGIANNAGTGTVDITNNTSTGNRLDVCNDGVIAVFSGNTFVTGDEFTACDFE